MKERAMVRGRWIAATIVLVLVVTACGGDNTVETLLESQEGIDNVEFDGGD
jgi:hypothetical protein